MNADLTFPPKTPGLPCGMPGADEFRDRQLRLQESEGV
jgi:hypothetical protein